MYYTGPDLPEGTGLEGMANLGIEPITTAALITAGTALVGSTMGVGTKIWGAKQVEEAQKKAIAGAKKRDEIEKAKLARAALRMKKEQLRQEALAAQGAMIEEAAQRRRTQTMALYAVLGVAGAVSLIFIAGGIVRRRRQAK